MGPAWRPSLSAPGVFLLPVSSSSPGRLNDTGHLFLAFPSHLIGIYLILPKMSLRTSFLLCVFVTQVSLIATLGCRAQLGEHCHSSDCWASNSGPLLRSSDVALAASHELDSISLSPMISVGPSLELLARAFHGHIALIAFGEEPSMTPRLSEPPFLLCKMEVGALYCQESCEVLLHRAELIVTDHGWCAGHSSPVRVVQVLSTRKECRSSCPRERATLGESHPPCAGVPQLSPYLKTIVGVAWGRMQVIQ